MNQREYWDGCVSKEFTICFDLGTYSKYVDTNSSILEVGCGYGRVLENLYQNCYEKLTGVDISPKIISQVKKNILIWT